MSPGNPLVSLLRVDILNIMGPSMVIAALLWWLAGGARAAALLCGVVATAIALVTPLVRTASWLPQLPSAVQWYISPAGNHSTFTLFPWSGFVFAGASFGSLLAMADRVIESKALARLAFAGLFIAFACYWASFQPAIYPSSSFWTTSPTYFGVRAGVMMAAMAAFHLLTPIAAAVPGPFSVLARLGRHSLFIYWIHVELVYGYATALIHHRLPLWLNAVAYLGLCAALYWSLDLRDRVVLWWRTHRSARPAPQTMGA
ncbi:MAG: hypothetical protein QM736_16100 [Vicinamibacterales bacterium]